MFSFLAPQTLQAPWTGNAAGSLAEGSRASLSGAPDPGSGGGWVGVFKVRKKAPLLAPGLRLSSPTRCKRGAPHWSPGPIARPALAKGSN